jgi:hypothetical protein
MQLVAEESAHLFAGEVISNLEPCIILVLAKKHPPASWRIMATTLATMADLINFLPA